MIRLDDGESGQLTTPLTTQNLAYQGAPNEATSSPTYSTNNVVSNGDSLTAAIGKLDNRSHSTLQNLSADDHVQYSKADGTRAFTGKVRGVSTGGGDPATTLTTKDYVDATAGISQASADVRYVRKDGNVNEHVTGIKTFDANIIAGANILTAGYYNATGSNGQQFILDRTVTLLAFDWSWTIFSDSGDATALLGISNQVIGGRTYRGKFRVSETGDVFAAGEFRGGSGADTYVKKSGSIAETVTGIKTFSSEVRVTGTSASPPNSTTAVYNKNNCIVGWVSVNPRGGVNIADSFNVTGVDHPQTGWHGISLTQFCGGNVIVLPVQESDNLNVGTNNYGLSMMGINQNVSYGIQPICVENSPTPNATDRWKGAVIIGNTL